MALQKMAHPVPAYMAVTSPPPTGDCCLISGSVGRSKVDSKLRVFGHSCAVLICLFYYIQSKLWTLTKKHEEIIDTFQRKLMRKILNLNWREKVSNDKVYKETNSIPWSQTIKRRRLTWYGHLLRLPEDTPARKSLKEAKNPCKKPRGGQKLTWIKQIGEDLEKVDFKTLVKNNKDGSFNTIQVKEHEKMAQNRHIWRLSVDRAMSL